MAGGGACPAFKDGELEGETSSSLPCPLRYRARRGAGIREAVHGGHQACALTHESTSAAQQTQCSCGDDVFGPHARECRWKRKRNPIFARRSSGVGGCHRRRCEFVVSKDGALSVVRHRRDVYVRILLVLVKRCCCTRRRRRRPDDDRCGCESKQWNGWRWHETSHDETRICIWNARDGSA